MVATLRLVLIAFAMATVTIAPVVAQTPQTPVDPQHLVGEWAGKWSGIWGTGSQTLSGEYILKVTKVQGEKVFGQVEWTNKGTLKSNLVGNFDGRRLTYGNAELIVDSDRMTGGRAVQNFPQGIKIDLTKAK
ncbi:MAG: hypothetical protein DMD91_20575 [Candidatus Rokuibacteriota bacterium]|nr:MAG: hypothetical protein DMD91_20575 [Candidatus Rokubacteria bacterium]